MLDTITWGNPLQKHLPFLDANLTPLEKHIPKFIEFPFPKNSSKATREELNVLIDSVEALKRDKEALLRYKAYDVSLERTFAQVIIEQQLGEKAITFVDSLFDETLPLILKLKFHFQRPRPYQLAQAYKVKLFPFESKSDNSPSYPSGHTLQARLICHVLGNHYPDRYQFFENLAKDVAFSRVYLGTHYPSDNDFSLFIADTIIRDKDFKAKYEL